MRVCPSVAAGVRIISVWLYTDVASLFAGTVRITVVVLVVVQTYLKE